MGRELKKKIEKGIKLADEILSGFIDVSDSLEQIDSVHPDIRRTEIRKIIADMEKEKISAMYRCWEELQSELKEELSKVV